MNFAHVAGPARDHAVDRVACRVRFLMYPRFLASVEARIAYVGAAILAENRESAKTIRVTDAAGVLHRQRWTQSVFRR